MENGPLFAITFILERVKVFWKKDNLSIFQMFTQFRTAFYFFILKKFISVSEQYNSRILNQALCGSFENECIEKLIINKTIIS